MQKKLLTMVLLLMVGAVSAAVSSGTYLIKSHNGKYLTEISSTHALACYDRIEGSYAQVWSLDVNGTGVTIQNVLTNQYVQGSTTYYQQWVTTSTPSTFTTTESGGVCTFCNSGSWGMHCDGNNVIVYWDSAEDNSKWTIEPVTVDESALSSQKAALDVATNEQLTTFFTSTACTALNSTYSGYSDEALRSAMSALSTVVQEMAVRVKNDAWATYDGWDKTERTFRIADYKAYSSHERWADILGYSNSFGRLSNPTGIYVAAGDYLQVYVGAVPAGQSVALEVAGYGQASGNVYGLHEGMNSLLMTSSGNCFVFYEVDNTTSGAAPFTALSNFADVTVHIEGGSVQGYLDLTKGDDNDDWSQMQTHLMSQETVCLKSSTHVFNLHRDLLLSALGTDGKVKEMMDCWKDVATLEDDLCARGDFDAYCNNIYSVTGRAGSGNPNATTYGTNYFEAEYAGVFNADQLLQYFGGLWTIAHEQGHNRQKLIKLAGTTEVSNNVFSNAVIDWQGRFTSRVLSLQTTFDVWQQGLSWLERLNNKGNDYHLWETLHLYVQLYQYFHQAGKDTDFFPNLFRAFRESPMRLQAGTPIPATDDYLKFYQTCCDVSGLDLTEFFEVYGFFTLPQSQEPQTINGISTGEYYQVIDDYNTYYVYVNQAMIDEAKANVEAKKYPKCNIIFIEDRVTAPLATYEGHGEGELRQLSRQDNVTAFGQVGETGQYTTFSASCSAYSYNISPRGNVTMEGTGAVGFKLYDESGKLVGLYNTTTFSLPSSAFDENGLKSGYSLLAAAGDGTSAAAVYDSNVEVKEFPKTGVWYTFCSTLRGARYMCSNGSGADVVGTSTSAPTEAMQWKFVQRTNGSEIFDIINRSDGSYVSPSAESDSQIKTSPSKPSAGWEVKAASTDGLYIVYSGSTQLNQTGHEGTNGYKIYNWGGGSNTTDAGCQFLIEEVNALSSTALDELSGLDISVASSAAKNLTTGQWYVMYNRGREGYLYETNDHTLYVASSAPTSGEATAACQYLVRLIDAGDGKYYLQTGYGNYFWSFINSTNVATTSQKSERVTIGAIGENPDHFYLQNVNNNVVLDANQPGTETPFVVGYGSSVPTQSGGNNDWAFYPVTLTRKVALNIVGDASYATLYLPYDVTTDENTKAYFVTEVADGRAAVTEVTGGEIPAKTAVVLINDAKSEYATLTATTGLAQQVSRAGNLLKGTLTSMSLDLSDSSPNYSLGVLNGNIGFYKFDNNGTTTITLGANKAYLEVPASGSSVKGFTLSFDGTEDDINQIVNGKSANGTWYDLNGRRLHGVPAAKGVYIVGGKKVVVK